MSQLGASGEVGLLLGALVVVGAIVMMAETDWGGRTRQLETNPDRLDALLELALTACRSMPAA